MSIARRDLLKAALVASVTGSTRFSRADAAPTLGIPGPFRGRVVAVNHPGSIANGKYQAEPVAQMMEKGMTGLTGAPAAADAWRYFFQPGDVVGIKMNPAGVPHMVSAPEVLNAIVNGLEMAGIKHRDIVVYDRYRSQFLQAGFDKWLPDGVRWMAATDKVDRFQLDMANYDPDQYMEMALLLPGADRDDRHYRRSYVARFLSKEVNKMVNVSLLKHHQSAGVTLALKNMSHGLVNNVSRSHYTASANTCGIFIPAVVDLPIVRQKVVLQILDGVQGGYHGGPGRKIGRYIWEHKTMYFGTDPVAIDRIGWKVLDEKRAEMKMLPIAQAGPDSDSSFVRMQPEHIELSATLGHGEADLSKIDVRRITLGA